MKYKDLKLYRVVFFLAFIGLPVLLNATNPDLKAAKTREKLVPPPPPMTISYSTPVCADYGNLIPTTTNFTTGGVYFSSPGGLNISGSGVINTFLSPPGTYVVQYYLSPYPPVQTNITIVALPNISISVAGSNPLCAGGSVVLTASGGNNYQWSNGLTTNPISVSPPSSTTYSVIGQNTFGCKNSKGQLITVQALPDVTVPQSTTVCKGSTVTLNAFSSNTVGVTYSWTPGGLIGANVVVSPTQSGPYSVRAFLNNCASATNPYELVVVTPTFAPLVNFIYPYPLCTNSPDPLPIPSASFQTGGTYYSTDPLVNVNPVTGQVNLSGLQPGELLISYSVAAVGCTLAAFSNVSAVINQGGNLVTSASEVTIEEGTSVTLGVSGGTSYYWDPPDFLDCSDCDSPIATPSVTTRFCVGDLVDGCILHACTDVIVVCVNNGDFALPNAFTPNGDNNNDKFCLQGWSYCVTNFKVMIFDRWGEKVYESTDPDFCWDGIFNGKLLNSGVYIYTISASINRNPISVKKGNITLIR